MAEDRDYIEEAQHEAQLRFGRELSPTELAEKFVGHDFEARVYHLKNLKSGDDELSVGEAAMRMRYEGTLHRAHQLLRKVDR